MQISNYQLLFTIYYMPSVLTVYTFLASIVNIKVNVRIIVVIILLLFQDEHLLDWSSFGLLDFQHIIFKKNHVKMWVSNMIHQAFEECLFVHLSIIIVLHCIMSFETTIKSY